MIARLWGVTLDCPEPLELARFYQRIGGGEIVSADDFFVELRMGGVSLGFQRDAGHRAPTWPEGDVPQQCHVDFSAADLDVAETEAVAVGARKAVVQPEPGTFRVLLDPAGHPFCLSVWGTDSYRG